MVSAAVALLIAQIATVALAAPHIQGYRHDPNVVESSTPCANESGDAEVYDQRQNGTENYRINVNGVVVLLAPAETILAAANLPNVEDELSSVKPPKVTTSQPLPLEASETVSSTPDGCEGGKCVTNSTLGQRGKLKMMNNLLQLFRNLKDDSHHAVIN